MAELPYSELSDCKIFPFIVLSYISILKKIHIMDLYIIKPAGYGI